MSPTVLLLILMAGLAAASAWALWLNLSETERRRIYGDFGDDRVVSHSENATMTPAEIATALGLRPSHLRAQWHGVLCGMAVTFSAPAPGLLALRDDAVKMHGLSMRTTVLRRMGRRSLPEPFQDLGDEAVSHAFVREPIRTRVATWMIEHGLTIENGELRIPSSPGGDDVTRVRALAELLAAMCATPNVVVGLRLAAREEPTAARRRRAIELLSKRFPAEHESSGAFRAALADAEPTVACLAGLLAGGAECDRVLREASAGAIAEAIREATRDVRPSALTNVGRSSAHAEAAAAGLALLSGGWIENDQPSLELAAAALGTHGTAETLMPLARERDLADGLRRDAIVSAIAALRRRFPDADTGGRLSVVTTSGGELSVASERGAVSMARKQDAS